MFVIVLLFRLFRRNARLQFSDTPNKVMKDLAILFDYMICFFIGIGVCSETFF